MKAAIVIPARSASTRLPGKLLLSAGGRPLLQHTYERAKASRRAAEVVVAAADEAIRAAVAGFGGRALMTDPAHGSGTARVAEAARALDADIIVNVQGDEPELDPAALDRLIALQAGLMPFASTLACPFPQAARLDDPAAVKAVLGRVIAAPPEAGQCREALYFTRGIAPFPRDGAPDPADCHLHIGVYAFRRDSLEAFARAPEGRLERIEKLEQLRILELGERMIAALTPAAFPGVDTEVDFAAFRARIEGS